MSRLLHAAARGAQIQFYGQCGDCHTWAGITRIPLEEAGRVYYRIHPEDEALQYGPISTALRLVASDTKGHMLVFQSTYGEFDTGYDIWLQWHDTDDELHRSLFLLILSEALADEGL